MIWAISSRLHVFELLGKVATDTVKESVYSIHRLVGAALATSIPKERCDKINLGYMNPAQIKVTAWEDREDQSVLIGLCAGEMLHRRTPGAASPRPGT